MGGQDPLRLRNHQIKEMGERKKLLITPGFQQRQYGNCFGGRRHPDRGIQWSVFKIKSESLGGNWGIDTDLRTREAH